MGTLESAPEGNLFFEYLPLLFFFPFLRGPQQKDGQMLLHPHLPFFFGGGSNP